MALYRESDLAVNEIYREIAENSKKRLDESVTSSNSIHAKVEDTMKDFASNLTSSVDAEATEEKLRDLEKDDLTNLDKKVITAIRKLVTSLGNCLDDFEKFQKGLKYEYVINKKDSAGKEDEVAEDADVDDTGDSEADMMGADKEFAAPAEEEPVKVESKFTSVKDIYSALTEKSPKRIVENKELDADATTKVAQEIYKALEKQFGSYFKMARNKDGFIVFNYKHINQDQAGAKNNDSAMTIDNISKVIEPWYRKLRQEGNSFTQPVGGEFSVGIFK